MLSEDLLTVKDSWLEEIANAESDNIHTELDAIKWANNKKGKENMDCKRKTKRNQVAAGQGTSMLPLFVSSEEDYTVVYELLLITFGLSTFLESKSPRASATSLVLPSDICWALRICAYATLPCLYIIS